MNGTMRAPSEDPGNETVFIFEPDYVDPNAEPSDLEPLTFAVGRPWPDGPEWVAKPSASWMPESNIFLIVSQMDSALVEDIARPIDIFVVAQGPLVGLILNFGNALEVESLRWQRPGQPIPHVLTREGPQRVAMVAVLVDVETKNIAAMHGFTLSPHATRVLQGEVSDRWAAGVTPEEGAAAIATWERTYPSTKAAKKDSFARCHAGN